MLPLPPWASQALSHIKLEYLAVAAAAFVLNVIFLHFFGKKRKLPPGPTWTLPLVGESLQFLRSPDIFLWERFCKYGPIFRSCLFGEWIVVLSDMDVVKELSRDTDKVRLWVPGHSSLALLPNLPFTRPVPEHKFWRKMMTSSLNRNAQEALLPKIKEIMNTRINEWADQGGVEIFRAAQQVSLDLGVDMLSGIPVEGRNTDWLKSQVRTLVDGLYSIVPLNSPLTAFGQAMQAKERICQAVWPDMYKEVRSLIEKGGKAKVDMKDPEAVQGMFASRPFLTMREATLAAVLPFELLKEKVVMDRTLGNVIAASDTTRNLFVTVLACVAKCERVQAKLYEEQLQVVKEHGEELTMTSLGAMPYLEATIKECMRLMSASQGGFRRAQKDIEVNGYVIPKGTAILWPHVLLHTLDPALWDGNRDPSKLPAHMDYRAGFDQAFQPERWLVADEDAKPRNYVAFGIGNHLCLGQQLVYVEARVMMSMLLRRYQLQLTHPDLLHHWTVVPQTRPKWGTDLMDMVPRLVQGHS